MAGNKIFIKIFSVVKTTDLLYFSYYTTVVMTKEFYIISIRETMLLPLWKESCTVTAIEKFKRGKNYG